MTTTPAEVIGANVRAELARHRISQTTLAGHLHLSQTAVSRRLNGNVPFNVDELTVVSELVAVPLPKLVAA